MVNTTNRLTAILAALAGLAAGAPVLAEDPEPSKGEAELAKMLEGRAAGEAVSCISDFGGSDIRIIDGTALVFRRGSTLYVNRPANAKLIDWNDLPIIERYGSQLCKLDRVELRDRNSAIPGPSLFLADFVPYTKVDEGTHHEGDVQ